MHLKGRRMQSKIVEKCGWKSTFYRCFVLSTVQLTRFVRHTHVNNGCTVHTRCSCVRHAPLIAPVDVIWWCIC